MGWLIFLMPNHQCQSTEGSPHFQNEWRRITQENRLA